MRPSERPRPGIEPLRDSDAADWLQSRPRAALLFWDETDDVSRRLRVRLEVVAAAADIDVGVLDVRTDALVAEALGVKTVPAVVVFRAGEVVERVLGAPPEGVLREALAAREG